jgi:hypothetical protein
MEDNIDALLRERARTHGDFSVVATVAQQLKDVARLTPGWRNLNDLQREALDMEFTKIARVLAGDPNSQDHWDDMAGYARLISKMLQPPPKLPKVEEDVIEELGRKYGANARIDAPTS